MNEQGEPKQTNWWGSTLSKLKSALAKTREAVVDSVIERQIELPQLPQDIVLEAPVEATSVSIVTSPLPRPIDEDYLEELEEKLIKADLGVSTTELLVKDLRREAKQKGWNSHDVEAFLKKEFESILRSAPQSKLNIKPGALSLVLVTGVNGTGKTTSIGKLCWRLKTEGNKVLVAAGDTFRAAAESQLEIWAQRAGVDIVRLADGTDPGAVVFQAIQKARNEHYNVLIIDTAGRLHNKANLMAELKKIRAVIDKHASDLPLESLLVIDASTGQNGLKQAKVFTEICPLTGVVLTKLDGTAKGGIVFSISRDLKIPVKLVGLGEQIDDLRDFEPELFVEALF
ncbi:MAG: signal recognition particle-docking protein FtsY [Candidatus Melainabacteria bacterium]|nr:signal recognition particle-docking protein FtsY [Candidatus Melainabacteria bacterium]